MKYSGLEKALSSCLLYTSGRGYAKKLEEHGMFTMGDVARMSERNEELLYQLFGKNAELLIDHAWGWEPTTIEAIKAYRPSSVSYTHLFS